MQKHQWSCPFCSSSSSRPQGLAAHIRYNHAKQYPKWLKNPERLSTAQQAGPEASDDAVAAPAPVQSAADITPSETSQTPPNAAEQLLHQAHGQLIARKQAIEAKLAHFDDLKKEVAMIDTQLEALDKTLAVFQAEPSSGTPEVQNAAASSAGD